MEIIWAVRQLLVIATPNLSCSGRADAAVLAFLRQRRRATEHFRSAEARPPSTDRSSRIRISGKP